MSRPVGSQAIPNIEASRAESRRRAFWVLLASLLLGGLLFGALEFFDALLWARAEREAAFLVRHPWLPPLIGMLLACPLLWASFTLFHIGRRAVRTQRMPPPGPTWFRPQRISYGPAARRRGFLLQVLASLLLLAAFALPVLLTILLTGMAVTYAPV